MNSAIAKIIRAPPVALLALPTQAFAQIATPAPPIPELLRVTRTDDNGEGSLRWAIERNNAAPGRFRIRDRPGGASALRD
jgi:3-dehydroshikimate dehydratase